MDQNVILALQYTYCKQLQLLKNGTIKGLKAKQAFTYKTLIEQLSIQIKNNKILDLEEVLSYGK